MKVSEQRNDILEDNFSFYVYKNGYTALAHLSTYKDKLVVILCYVIYVALNYAYNSYEFWQTNKQYNRADLRLPCPPIQHCNLLVISSTSDTTFYVQVYKSCLIFNRLSFLRSGQCYM